MLGEAAKVPLGVKSLVGIGSGSPCASSGWAEPGVSGQREGIPQENVVTG